MKKNYLEPVIKVQTIALQSMIAMSIPVDDNPGSGGPGTHDRSDLLDDWK